MVNRKESLYMEVVISADLEAEGPIGVKEGSLKKLMENWKSLLDGTGWSYV